MPTTSHGFVLSSRWSLSRSSLLGVASSPSNLGDTAGEGEDKNEALVTSSASSSSASIVKGTPSLITFEAIDVLVQARNPLGLVYRDTLLECTGLMLPRPDVFDDALREAVAKNSESSPGFGGSSDEESILNWWRQTTRDTYETILLEEDLYDEEEISIFEKTFETVFQTLQTRLLDEAWEPVDAVYRILSELRDWRDNRGGPKIGVVSSAFDGRLKTLLRNVIGEDECTSTFDFILTPSDQDRTLGETADIHVDIAGDADNLLALAPASSDELSVLPTLRDLISIWELPSAPEDDLVQTTRLYSVYEEAWTDDDEEDESVASHDDLSS